MDSKQLRHFVAIAEAGSISRAASRQGVTQPSLSQQIKKLEDHLGVPLFDRLGRGIVLTDAGSALLPKARRILTEIQDAETQLRSDAGAGAGRIAVGAIPTMAPYLLPPLLARLRHEYPACEIVIREDLTQSLLEAVADNKLDLAIASTPIDHELVEIDIIATEPLYVVAPADHPICGAPTVAIPDLREQPAVTLSEMHCLGQQVQAFCATRRLAGNVVCSMTQVHTLLEFVRLGLGVSILPAMVAKHDDNPGRRYLRFKKSPPRRDISILWRKGRTKSTLAQALAAMLRIHLTRASTATDPTPRQFDLEDGWSVRPSQRSPTAPVPNNQAESIRAADQRTL